MVLADAADALHAAPRRQVPEVEGRLQPVVCADNQPSTMKPEATHVALGRQLEHQCTRLGKAHLGKGGERRVGRAESRGRRRGEGHGAGGRGRGKERSEAKG